jgi:REP element-mobilizing transposase RayT
MHPLAYHLTWTTYGTWLPGDARGWVRRGEAGVKPADPAREEWAREHMEESAVLLSAEQRDVVARTIRDHCRIRGWVLHAVNVRRNHVHVVVTCACDGRKARDEFKAWSSRRLSDLAGLTEPVAYKAGRRRWWTEGGDVRAINDERYLANAAEYVAEGQGG